MSNILLLKILPNFLVDYKVKMQTYLEHEQCNASTIKTLKWNEKADWITAQIYP